VTGPVTSSEPGRPNGVSVVICAYTLDRWAELVSAVRSCVAQTLAPDQVIVVIDHNDALLERASHELGKLGGAVVAPNRFTQGLSGARNTGVSLAAADVVAFLDDDAQADPDWLKQLCAPLRDPGVVGTGGWVTPDWEARPPGWFPDAFSWVIGCSYPGLPPTNGTLRNPIGTNMAMRRSLFTRVGGFTSGLGRVGKVPLGCEETELAIRHTSRYPRERFVMVREAVVHHRVPAWRLTWHYFWTRCWSEGISKAVVSSLVGRTSGLSAERSYVLQSLPRAVARSLRLGLRHPVSAAAQVGAVVAGTACAGAGLVRGTLAVHSRHNPLGRRDAGTDLGDLADLADLDDPGSAMSVARRSVPCHDPGAQ
jgi:glucosyl-dolichyl phosphate glucuronosyltransferase